MLRIEKNLIKAKKSLGQNFLKDKNIVKKITKLTKLNNEKLKNYKSLSDRRFSFLNIIRKIYLKVRYW